MQLFRESVIQILQRFRQQTDPKHAPEATLGKDGFDKLDDAVGSFAAGERRGIGPVCFAQIVRGGVNVGR